jgi:hypothetical protein
MMSVRAELTFPFRAQASVQSTGGPALLKDVPTSLNGSFGLNQFVCARSAEHEVWRGGPWARRPAALLYILALFPVRRDFL